MPAPTDPAGGYLRSPTLHGDRLVFGCEDALWTVPAGGGTARRLTAAGVASGPRLSPSGAEVAFARREDGGPAEVCVLPADGGPVRQLTFHGVDCSVAGWSPDGTEVLHATGAGGPFDVPGLWAVPVRGGAPRPLRLGPADSIGHGPDGAVVLGRTPVDPVTWKRYRGGTAGVLWVGPTGAGPFRRLLDLDGNLSCPCWVGDRVFFLSDHEGPGDVHSCDPDGGRLRRHTRQGDFAARALTSDGRRLAYQAGARLYLLDPDADPDAEPVPVPVRVPGTGRPPARRVPWSDAALESAEVGADGRTLAVVARGRAYTLGPGAGPARRHGDPGVRHRLLGWLDEGRLVAAVRDVADGGDRLVVLAASGDAPPVPVDTGDLGRVTELAVAPGGARVAVANHRHELRCVPVPAPGGGTGGGPTLLDRAAYDRITDLAWSPDGCWLAYTRRDSPHGSVVVLSHPDTGLGRAVDPDAVRDRAPSFDPDGRFLALLGVRDPAGTYDLLGAGAHVDAAARPYAVVLRDGGAAPFRGGPDPGPADRPLRVDLDGIEERLVAVPAPPGPCRRVLAVPGALLLLHDPGDLHRVDTATGAVEPVAQGVRGVSAGPGGRWTLVRTDRLRVLDPAGRPAPGTGDGRVELERIRLTVDPAADWELALREAWTLQRDHFWSADLGGVDWPGVYRRHRALLDRVATRAELSDLVAEMQGELGSSHVGERPAPAPAEPARQGLLGVDWEAGPDGWRVGRLLGGAGPRPGADVRPGDLLLAVDGEPVGPPGPAALLAGLAGREVQLRLRRGGGPPHLALVRALDDERPLRYADWVRANRRRVRERSGDRLGYLHVPDTGAGGWARFHTAFLAEYDRDGLVVDLRFNAGGALSGPLADRLSRRRVGYRLSRWGPPEPYPPESPRGPMVALVNEFTGSDGELLAHLVRARGLGPLVGRRTWGGGAGIRPRQRLVDGAVTTQPEFRFVLAGTPGVENHGVQPDVDVDLTPDDHRRGADPQLDRAVDLLLADLDRHPTAAAAGPGAAGGPAGLGTGAVGPAAGGPGSAGPAATRPGGP